MNHDATHCIDYTPRCPKTCYRARLTIDLESRFIDFIGVPMSWSHFKDTDECELRKEMREES